MEAGTKMVLKEFRYSLQGGGYETSDDPGLIGQRFVKTLDDLNRIDPIYSNWLLTDNVKLEQIRLADVRDDIAALVENNVSRDDDDEPEPDWGYYMCGFNAPIGGPRTISFSVTAARKGTHTFEMSFGRAQEGVDAAVVNYPLFKASLLTIIANWPCAWATATGFKSTSRTVPERAGVYRLETESFHRMTWLAYLSSDGITGLDLPPDIATEQTPDGGLLMIAAKERPDSSSPDQMMRTDFLTAIMTGRSQPAP